ncbi:apolipoprotein N-acyltransferase [Arhodomonas sp. KWT]|uniref:apolipoprotein N-acyltransferase n=1 Tax=Arhodomonas sp. KWT TaxID=2679915 RepID=UPI0013D305C3|nr:apolipoprotein N-acyltransferase [Arhodomonas sp. KWT]
MPVRVLTGRAGPFLALLAGLAMALGFAPYGHGWIVPPALAVAFAQVAAAPRRRAALGAYLFGLGYAGAGVYWIFISISRYGGGPLAASAVTPLMIALFALYPLAALMLGRWVGAGRRGVTTLAALPAAWLLVEWVRSWLFTGATWLAVGYTQVDLPPGALAPVLGLYGVGVLVCAPAGGLAWLALRPDARRLGVAAALIAAYLASGALWGVHWSRPAGPAMDVALVQGNVPQDKKWLVDNRVDTLRYYAQASRRHYGTPLIVWPEAAVPAFYDAVAENFLDPLAEEAADAGSHIVTGVPARGADGGAYNAVVVLGQGPATGYFKRHLVPFGEYVPFRGLLGGALDFIGAPLGDFSAGTEPAPLTVDGVTIGASVCYEVTFGPLIADALPQAQVLLNVSNDGWFGDSAAPHQHLEMARMRALETGREMLRATNTGITAVIGADGTIRAQAPQFERTVLEASVRPRRGETPYVVYRDVPAVALVLAVLVLAAGLARAPRRRAD